MRREIFSIEDLIDTCVKEVNKLKDWQVVLMVLGGGMVAVIGYKVVRLCGI